MKLRYIILLMSGWLTVIGAMAQVTVTQQLDTNQIFIGEQVLLKVKVTANANDLIVMPNLAKSNVVDGVEVINQYVEKQETLNGGRRKSITQAYRITSFDSALYRIPPIEVEVNQKPYHSETGNGFKVVSPEVDTVHVNKFLAPKECIDVVYDWDDFKRPMTFWALGVLLLMAAVYMAVQIRNNHRLLPKLRLFPEPPPHKWAMKQISVLNAHKPTAPEDAHLYYAELTDIIRSYISKRYGFKATAMTSEQIITYLKDVNDPKLLSDLREMFNAADLVKYAGVVSEIKEDDRNLLIAMEYVNCTKDIQQEKQKPVEVKEEPKVKRSRNTRNLLIGATVVVALAGMVLFLWSVAIMYDLYF